MSTVKHSTKVTICGEEYTIKSEVPPERTRAVAAHVAALSNTDELFRERDAAAEVAESMAGLSGELRRWLPPGKRGESVQP
jgi:hypothetical protein